MKDEYTLPGVLLEGLAALLGRALDLLLVGTTAALLMVKAAFSALPPLPPDLIPATPPCPVSAAPAVDTRGPGAFPGISTRLADPKRSEIAIAAQALLAIEGAPPGEDRSAFEIPTPGRIKGWKALSIPVSRAFLPGGLKQKHLNILQPLQIIRMERQFTRRQIETAYLASAWLGRDAYGLECAAQVYFGKPADGLTVAQAAYLAGLAKTPAGVKIERYRQIVDALAERGLIGPAEAQEARTNPPL